MSQQPQASVAAVPRHSNCLKHLPIRRECSPKRPFKIGFLVEQFQHFPRCQCVTDLGCLYLGHHHPLNRFTLFLCFNFFCWLSLLCFKFSLVLHFHFCNVFVQSKVVATPQTSVACHCLHLSSSTGIPSR